MKSRIFEPGDYVAIGASGGKDSTVLAHIMKTLNERYNYGLKLVLLSIDEGITGKIRLVFSRCQVSWSVGSKKEGRNDILP